MQNQKHTELQLRSINYYAILSLIILYAIKYEAYLGYSNNINIQLHALYTRMIRPYNSCFQKLKSL